MRTFTLNKLVRDKILPDMERLGQQVLYRKLTDEAHLKALAAKLVEEAGEFKLENTKDALKELADLLEAIEALASELGSDFEALRKLQQKRRQERGGFKDRIFIEQVSIPNGDKWANYYGQDPIKYPEIKE